MALAFVHSGSLRRAQRFPPVLRRKLDVDRSDKYFLCNSRELECRHSGIAGRRGN